MPSKRMVPEQEVAELGDEVYRLTYVAENLRNALSKATAEIARLSEQHEIVCSQLAAMFEQHKAARAEIAALTEQRDEAIAHSDNDRSRAKAYRAGRDAARAERDHAWKVSNQLTEQRDELRRQNAEKADLLDRCIALFRKNGDYPTLTQEIVAALTSAPQAALDTETAAESAPSLPETP